MKLTNQRIGTWLEFFARATAILISATYAEGYWFGQNVHELNDALAQRRMPRFIPMGPIFATMAADYRSVWYYAPASLTDYLDA